jgi:hypothetical protein
MPGSIYQRADIPVPGLDVGMMCHAAVVGVTRGRLTQKVPVRVPQWRARGLLTSSGGYAPKLKRRTSQIGFSDVRAHEWWTLADAEGKELDAAIWG